MRLIRIAAFWVLATLQFPAYADERSPVIFEGFPPFDLGATSKGTANRLTFAHLMPFDESRNSIQFVIEIVLAEPYPLPANANRARTQNESTSGPVEVEKHYVRTFCDGPWVWPDQVEYWSSDHHIVGNVYFDRRRPIAQGGAPTWEVSPTSILGQAQAKVCELAGPRTDWIRR